MFIEQPIQHTSVPTLISEIHSIQSEMKGKRIYLVSENSDDSLKQEVIFIY